MGEKTLNDVVSILVHPPRDRGKGKRPAFPYKRKRPDRMDEWGYVEIRDENDAADAIRDQVNRLDATFDRNLLFPLHRLLVLLKTDRYKTIDCLLHFLGDGDPNLHGFKAGFTSDFILICTDPDTSTPICHRTAVDDLRTDFLGKFMSVGMSVNMSGKESRRTIRLLATVALFPTPSAPERTGLSLEMIVRGYGDTKDVAAQQWHTVITLLVSAFQI
jgi:hypothetical protein